MNYIVRADIWILDLYNKENCHPANCNIFSQSKDHFTRFHEPQYGVSSNTLVYFGINVIILDIITKPKIHYLLNYLTKPIQSLYNKTGPEI
jgi:hypothetical protein